ncbi:M20 family metallopeptidase [Bradyrhizobium sp. WSM 1738]|uniref:M20 family metallopeptidase n=1 Tax=Bradyrhizobium hereditatis TaxID=2821405 RepID=UPI001CE34092|nr:M20 family metallopeptidase [Bradyrhizobium hereditatis]MCA6119284.1 M20 family metallopeptidase [Bradyrhizobium hereditatis]
MPIDPIELSRELIAFNTVNPPGNELSCIQYLEKLLAGAGLETALQRFASGRANLVARIKGTGSKPPLCFTGHVDTVPLGNAPWSVDPFAGEIIDGKMYGRGSTDMKCGVAAFVAAIADMAGQLEGTGGVVLVITAGEEIGCEGAFHLARADLLGRAGALVVAEPTSNAAMVGHKGALWLRLTLKGVTAHGSMPHLGVNAAFKAARVLTALETFQFNVAPHPYLGSPTLSVGTVRAGLNVNSVPDFAEIGIDIRSIPGLDHSRIEEHLKAELGDDILLEAIVDVGAVWTDPNSSWIKDVYGIVREVTGEDAGSEPRTAPYFTDASALTPALGNPPTIILGPGEAARAHQTDEYCSVQRIREASDIYSRIAARWVKAE